MSYQYHQPTPVLTIHTSEDSFCPKIFVSGPMTGFVNYNSERFIHFQKELEALDWFVINPWHNDVPRDEPFYLQLRQDFRMLLQADAIFSLEGWEDSLGATMEYLIARNSGMPQFLESEGTLPDGDYYNRHNLQVLSRSQPIPRPLYRGIINAESTNIFQENSDPS